ncbi:MAG: acetate--CoA ligase family protein [Alphaproteobacteria bacterium]
MPHWLTPLFAPRHVAVVGASPRSGSHGNEVLRVLRDGGFGGTISPVNPNYGEIDGLPCHGSVAALPSPPDMAILAVAGSRLEAALDDAIKGGAKGVVVFDNCYLEGDRAPPLLERLKARAAEARIPVCGGNGMGFYNYETATHASFYHPAFRTPGSIALIAHSGSVFTHLVNNDPRFRFNLAISPGQEINATTADYLDYALDLPSTRVVAIFLEAVRDPAGFAAALDKARAKDIPIVAVKLGRTEESVRLAATHTKAIAGDDAVYDALFDRYGVRRARDLDEMMAAAQLLALPRRAGPGALSGITDSGGLRELWIDLASEQSVAFARLGTETSARIQARLPTGLEVSNPLDAAGPLHDDFGQVFADCLALLMADRNTAIGAFEFDLRDDFAYWPALVDTAKTIPAESGKPFFVFHSFSRANNAGRAAELIDAGVPLINGVTNALAAVRHALAYRDWRARDTASPPPAPEGAVRTWTARLSKTSALSEAECLAMLRDFGVPAAESLPASSAGEAVAAAERLGYPVVLKTAAPGILHKSERGGVRLALADTAAVRRAYEDVANRLGPQVILQRMAEKGVELALGMIADPQFGPAVMVGAGGVLVEFARDRVFALAPFDAGEARRLIDRLRIRPLLDGVRGAPAADIAKLADAVARFSVLAASLSRELAEIDVNPLIAGPGGPLAVDAIVLVRPWVAP